MLGDLITNLFSRGRQSLEDETDAAYKRANSHSFRGRHQLAADEYRRAAQSLSEIGEDPRPALDEAVKSLRKLIYQTSYETIILGIIEIQLDSLRYSTDTSDHLECIDLHESLGDLHLKVYENHLATEHYENAIALIEKHLRSPQKEERLGPLEKKRKFSNYLIEV